ncbi:MULTISPECIES: SGNH/GDSL hydrolase family protein [unclassified Paenibacillus]|uniref:SGNH/GDSL hydrolase family protein n=1 Tax=Paenibacillus provencensis TaxID=441151 RepID=A0ABW3PRK4_9BACL|nr:MULTISPECIES: SGNH/GDSL hydrolase family protein [unclassified Paenibacillus]MCM3127410.1 SGNH/GDSL hydrolase family protein [Paenibacillus sp. MER 78]SFS43063.1 Lysophospholipase L1 [Paenibacillus sp. 453mf]
MLGEYVSATAVSTATNFIMIQETAFTRTYRTYIRLRENGPLEMKFWHSNAVDSTWDVGAIARGSMAGGEWKIESAYVAVSQENRDGSVVPGSGTPITFEGEYTKQVQPGEQFWSDAVTIDVLPGRDLVFTWTITTEAAGKSFPYNTEGLLVSSYAAEGIHASEDTGTSFTPLENQLVLPAFIGYKRDVKHRMIFLGDSITQGVRTLKDGYEYWVARIAAGLNAENSVWNIGSGWARAYDAAADGSWLQKARQGDIVALVLGVNDIDIGARTSEELLEDLTSIVQKLKQKPGAEPQIILFTVPPFNFAEHREENWRTVNETIRTRPPEGVDYVFDIAELLSCTAPEEYRIQQKYMSNEFDPHPNGEAGKQVADAFLKWFQEKSL